MSYGVAPGGLGPRRAASAAAGRFIATVIFQKIRCGVLLSTIMVVAAVGGLLVAFGWQDYRDPYRERSHGVTLTFYGVGLVMCALGIVGPILVTWRGARWTHTFRRTVTRDRMAAARGLAGPVPVELATLWDVRRPEQLLPGLVPALPGILRAPHVRHSRLRGGWTGLLVALLTCVVGLVNLWDPIDPPVEHAPGTRLASTPALATGITYLVAWTVLWTFIARASDLRDVHLVEVVAYGWVLPGGEEAAMVGVPSRRLTGGPLAVVVILLVIGVARFLRDPLAAGIAMAIVALFLVPVIVVRVLRRRHPRTLPMMTWDQKGPAPLGCAPACRVELTAQPGMLHVVDRQGTRPALTLAAHDVVAVVDVVGVSGTVAVTGTDDILLALTGNDAGRLIREWWAENRTEETHARAAE
ncbi:hypothetical protein [Leekyejoonella antrihumi]|uniref:Uncharacterized protein n=1 Tax=Leekyejoonella antrihumi TaxID=1660198 RepID=A0A563DZI7_9MICO|nr:hypothetical protein [Leekyejoonella antrihumi]TWP35678.1 hypothetical protein FGL98_12745 [Leekyejoonella antrihumi]